MSSNAAPRGISSAAIRRSAIATIAILLAGFFIFVGFNKAFDSLSDLTRYGSWTIWIPVVAGKAVGWSEILCGAGLIAGLSERGVRFSRLAAAILIVNQLAAAAVHAAHGENGALSQNAILILLLLIVAMNRPASGKSSN